MKIFSAAALATLPFAGIINPGEMNSYGEYHLTLESPVDIVNSNISELTSSMDACLAKMMAGETNCDPNEGKDLASPHSFLLELIGISNNYTLAQEFLSGLEDEWLEKVSDDYIGGYVIRVTKSGHSGYMGTWYSAGKNEEQVKLTFVTSGTTNFEITTGIGSKIIISDYGYLDRNESIFVDFEDDLKSIFIDKSSISNPGSYWDQNIDSFDYIINNNIARRVFYNQKFDLKASDDSSGFLPILLILFPILILLVSFIIHKFEKFQLKKGVTK